MIDLKVKRVHPNAQIPALATSGAACFDMHAVDADTFEPHPTDRHAVIYRTGLAFEVPPGFALMIYSRSGHGFKEAIRLSNCVGVIDSDYRGEVKVSLRADGDMPRRIQNGDRIAQAMLTLVPVANLIEVEELSETARGEGGFGSTGTGAVPAQTAVLDMVQYERDDESIQCALLLVGEVKEVPLDVIATWTLEQCIQAHDWALAVHMKASDNDDVVVPPRPAFLDAYEMDTDERYASLRLI
jgi:dUTP pyrophosphatase